jgi:hypothetical protein
MTHKIQIDDQVRDATDEEAAAIEVQHAAAIAEKAAADAAIEARKAPLRRLGLTDDEIDIVLGL